MHWPGQRWPAALRTLRAIPVGVLAAVVAVIAAAAFVGAPAFAAPGDPTQAPDTEPVATPSEPATPTPTAPVTTAAPSTQPPAPSTAPGAVQPTSAPTSAPPTTTPATTAPGVVERPATPPAVRDSAIPLVSIVIAVLVLVGAWFAVRRIARQRDEELAAEQALVDQGLTDGGLVEDGFDEDGAKAPADASEVAATAVIASAIATGARGDDDVREPVAGAPDDATTVAFLIALGRAMLDSGDPVTHVTSSLRRVAAVNGVDGAGIVVLPTALFVTVPGTRSAQTSVASTHGSLQLHQVEAVFGIVGRAETGDIDPARGLVELAQARNRPAPFTFGQQLAGYTFMTFGLALMLRGTLTDLALAVVLGTMVGAMQLRTARIPQAYQVFLPVGAAFFVSVVVFVLGRAGADIGVFTPVIAPLVTFLPGALLTTAVLELATGQMMSGAGRLAAGGMQLVLLALGIISAAQLVGVPATTIVDSAPAALGALSPWVGVAVFGAGVVLARGARRESLGWILLILYVAYAGQLVGGLLFGSELSGFVGALVMTPVAMFVALQRGGPPTLVTFLPAFWILVPGAVGLTGVTKYLSDSRIDGLATLAATGATMLGISFGVLLGIMIGTFLGLGTSGTPGVDKWRIQRPSSG